MRVRHLAPLAGAGKPADYDAILPMPRARRGGIFPTARRKKFSFRRGPGTGYDTPAHAGGMTDSRD
jgi:hypothetical protein